MGIDRNREKKRKRGEAPNTGQLGAGAEGQRGAKPKARAILRGNADRAQPPTFQTHSLAASAGEAAGECGQSTG